MSSPKTRGSRRSYRTKRRAAAADPYQHALVHHREGRLDAARLAYEALLRSAPEHAEAHAMLGVLHLQSGDATASLAALDRALALDPEQPGFHLNRGNTLRALGRLDEAVEDYARAGA